MIDYQQTFRMYKKWLAWPHCKEVDISLCDYYQDKCKFYLDEVKYKEEPLWYIIGGILFYLFIMPIILLMWCVLVGIMNIYHWIRR